ncbi:hypothetical protein PVAP13_2KG266600 [Panicum virgatum]|uniref:Uncharacterized protein n=1 Tax=Panicum virgatum TaxID=38727 RepID=A0A8T0WBH3_PANVG|nr:hypothetical protein PVAP13_2KG266600 [Panicum virgatum]
MVFPLLRLGVGGAMEWISVFYVVCWRWCSGGVDISTLGRSGSSSLVGMTARFHSDVHIPDDVVDGGVGVLGLVRVLPCCGC